MAFSMDPSEFGAQTVGVLVNAFKNTSNPRLQNAYSQLEDYASKHPSVPIMERFDNAEQEYLKKPNEYVQNAFLESQQKLLKNNPRLYSEIGFYSDAGQGQGQTQDNSGKLFSLGLSFGSGSDSGGTTANKKESVLGNVAAKNTGTNLSSATAWEKALNNANNWRR